MEGAALAILARPLLTEAHPLTARRVPRVGVLGEVNPIPWTVRTAVVDVECRWAERRHDRLPALAAELLERDVDVIVTAGTRATRAARQVTRTVPIVFVAGGEPVEDGLVASVARPGGNVTGLSVPSDVEMARQRLAALAQARLHLERVAVLANPDNPSHEQTLRQLDGTAAGLAVDVQPRAARSVEEIECVFDTMTREKTTGVVVLPDALFAIHARWLVDLAAQHQMPAVYGARSFVEAGGLMAVHGDTAEVIRRLAALVARVLAGGPPATMPVQRFSHTELTVNLGTARKLGLQMTRSLLTRAAVVIGA